MPGAFCPREIIIHKYDIAHIYCDYDSVHTYASLYITGLWMRTSDSDCMDLVNY